tara:strand:+ start:195 stop:725 length:531 start_codon:yes stop_codon:yes gene_type:complete
MDKNDTLEYFINNNVHNNFNKKTYIKVITDLNRSFTHMIVLFTDEVLKLPRFIQCCNIHGIFNTLQALNKLTSEMDNMTNKTNDIIKQIYILEYIKLKQTIQTNMLPIFKNSYKMFVGIINNYNIQIRSRILNYLDKEGYDIELSEKKYNSDMDGLNNRLVGIHNKLIECMNIKQS